MKKYLVINPFGIGDVLFTTPVVRALKSSDKSVYVGYWCNERVRPVLENNAHIDSIFALSRGDIKKVFRESKLAGIRRSLGLLSDLRKKCFDISLDFSLDHRYSLLSKICGIKERIGIDYKKRNRFLTERIEVQGYSDRHVVEYYLGLLDLLGIKRQGLHLEAGVSEADRLWAKELFTGLGINEHDPAIGIAPGAGASWGKDAALKHWPAEKFALLADKLSQELGAKVLLLGDAGERAIAGKMTRLMRAKPIDLTGKTDIGGLCAVLERLKILVANDGGPLHLGVALGIKTVSIFGPVDEKVYGPYPPSKKNAVVTSDISCRPCYKNFRLTECRNAQSCIFDIGVEEVYNAVKDMT